ncbi:hypothetical protein ACVWXL_006225 [Bradyrhizobium sp. GM22.5]
MATPVRSSSTREVGDLVAQAVHRHQQEAEIERHGQEQETQHHDAMSLAAGACREIAAEQIAHRADDEDRDNGEDDDAGQPGARTDAAFRRRQQQTQRQHQRHGLTERVAEHAQLHVVEADHEEHDAGEA